MTKTIQHYKAQLSAAEQFAALEARIKQLEAENARLKDSLTRVLNKGEAK